VGRPRALARVWIINLPFEGEVFAQGAKPYINTPRTRWNLQQRATGQERAIYEGLKYIPLKQQSTECFPYAQSQRTLSTVWMALESKNVTILLFLSSTSYFLPHFCLPFNWLLRCVSPARPTTCGLGHDGSFSLT